MVQELEAGQVSDSSKQSCNPPRLAGSRSGFASLVLPFVLPILASLIVYANATSSSLVFDDRWTLSRLSEYTSRSIWSVLWSSRGFTYATHLVDGWIFGDWIPGRHIVNVCLHALNSALAAGIAIQLGASRRVGLMCGLLFAVHPVHVEAVALLSYRKDLLAMLFGSCAVLIWRSAWPAWTVWPATAACLVLGAFSKEVAVAGVLPILIVTDLLFGARGLSFVPPRWRVLVRSLPLLLPLLVLAPMIPTRAAVRSEMECIRNESNLQVDNYAKVLGTALGSIPEVGRLLIWPATLSADYPIRPQPGPVSPRPLFGVGLVISWGFASLLLARHSPMAAFGMLWTLLAYLPCSNLVPLTHMFVAERYLYVPSFGVCLILALAIDRLMVRSIAAQAITRSRLVQIGALLLIVMGGTRSALRNRDWQSEYRLWTSSLRAGIESRRIHANLSNELVRQGRYNEAIRHCASAVRLRPTTENVVAFAELLEHIGQRDPAIRICRHILAVSPGNPRAQALLDTVLARGAARQ